MILASIAVLMIGLGVLMQSGKGSFLISGYNTMSKEQQAQVDIKGLNRLMAYYAYFLALIFLAMWLFEWLNEPNGMIACVVVLFGSSVVVIVKSQKFYANVTHRGKFGKGAKWSGIISIVILIGVGIVLYFAAQPTKLTATADSLTIGGMYGETFAWSEITELALLEDMLAISMRTNGSALGSKLQGHFKLENGDKVKLFIDKSKPPFITFVAGGKRFYMNKLERGETESLFAQMEHYTK